MLNQLIKIFRKNAGIGLAVLVFVAGYFYYISSIKIDRYQIFNVKKTVTWAQSQNTIYRTHAYGMVDNILLSEDDWREYDFSMKVVGVKDCGFIYDYVDANNYNFVYLKVDSGGIVSGQLKDGKTQNLKSAAFVFPSLFNVSAKKNSGVFQFLINGRMYVENYSNASFGKLGFMVNSVDAPPVIFYQIAIKGLLENGQAIAAQVGIKPDSGMLHALKYFIPFYLGFVFLILLLPAFIVKSAEVITVADEKTAGISKWYFPFFLHAFLAGCFFWPFIARGEVAVFSYDNLGEIFPLLYYAQQNFLNILHGHFPWLWNPLIHNGFPFYSNHWDMIYYPLNWPVFLVAQEHLLTAVTLKSFVEVAALGMFAYGFFVIELKNKRWALFSSIVYQLCSLLIFTMGIFPATSTYFAMTFYLYVLWSVPHRRALVNLVLLILAVVLVLTSANVAFVFYACLSLAVISLYRFWSVNRAKDKLFILAVSAWIIGMLMSSVRIFSCLEGVTASNRMAQGFNTIHDRVYMGVRLLVPEIAGWMGPDAFNVFMSPNLRLIFRELELPSSNPQNCFFVYFGILPALLLIASFAAPAKGKHFFWKIYSLIALGIALLWQPFWGILSILCLPLNHYSYHMIILPVGICALIGYSGMAWEESHWGNGNFYRNLAVLLGLAVAYLLVFLTYLFPPLASLMRIIFLVIGLGIAVCCILRRCSNFSSEKFLSFILSVLNVLVITLLISVTLFLTLAPIPKKETLGLQMILPFLWFWAVVSMTLSYYYGCQGYPGAKKAIGFVLAPLSLAFFLNVIFVFSSVDGLVLGWAPPLRVYAIDVWIGFVRLLLLLQIGLLGFCGIRKGFFSVKWTFMIFLAVTIMDLIVFNARFNNITSPFYFKNAFYPRSFTYRDMNPALRKQMDLINYRVSHQDRRDFNANKNLVFSLPSYTGTVGYMTKRFSKLLTSFGYVDGIYMLYPEDATENVRFLDISAVRYVFEKNGELVVRPSALGRLNLLYSFETIVDDDVLLGRLKDGTFDPHKTVLLSEPVPLVSREQKDAVFIPILSSNPDRIEGHVSAAASGVLLFSESYDAGWKAYLNGSPVAILRANYNFMACMIPRQGDYDIRFVYEPAHYRRNLYMSALGTAVFFLLVLAALIKGKFFFVRQ